MTSPGESPTKLQAQAFRFGVRRLESAVASGDPLMRGDSVRRRTNVSLIISFALAVLIAGAFAVYGFIKPAPTIGSASVVIDSDTGAAYVSRNGILYPALNLSSALLAAGQGSSDGSQGKPSVATVDTDTIGTQPRGPELGIVGAPNVLPDPSQLVPDTWTVCDTTTQNTSGGPKSAPKVTTTAILGQPAPTTYGIGTKYAMIVTPVNGTGTWLLWQGKKSKLKLGVPAVSVAFAQSTKSSLTPRPISSALLNAIPQSGDIGVPTMAKPASQPSWAVELGVSVGEVFALQAADGSLTTYVALAGGYQKIGTLLGDIIRDSNSPEADLPRVQPIQFTRVNQPAPKSEQIDTSLYPTDQPTILGYSDDADACVSRTGNSASTAVITARPSLPLPAKAKAVAVVRPSSKTVDAVYLAPGHGAVVCELTSTQPAPCSNRSLFLVTDGGLAYPVVDSSALALLGYGTGAAAPAVPELLDLLPVGTALDPAAAVQFFAQGGQADESGSTESLPSATTAAAASASAAQSPSG